MARAARGLCEEGVVSIGNNGSSDSDPSTPEKARPSSPAGVTTATRSNEGATGGLRAKEDTLTTSFKIKFSTFPGNRENAGKLLERADSQCCFLGPAVVWGTEPSLPRSHSQRVAHREQHGPSSKTPGNAGPGGEMVLPGCLPTTQKKGQGPQGPLVPPAPSPTPSSASPSTVPCAV